jgi:hypothetical protein
VVKKTVLGLLVLASAAGLLGAQEAKMAFGVNAFPLVKGLIWSDADADNSLFALSPGFEFLIAPHFAAGVGGDIYLGEASKIDILYFGVEAHGRWYPLSEGLDKLFIDAGLGFNSFMLDGELDSDKGGMTGITMSLKAGWKVMFGAFFAEPSMAFVYAKTPLISVPTPAGWQPGLSIGMTF